MRMSIRYGPPMRWCIGGPYRFCAEKRGGVCLDWQSGYRDIQPSNFFITVATGLHVATKYQARGTKQKRKRLAE